MGRSDTPVFLSYLPDEVLSQIIARVANPHSLAVTCRSFFALAHLTDVQTDWWCHNQRVTSLLRLFRWGWLQKAALTCEQLDNLLSSILSRRQDDRQSSWHGAFAWARCAVILELRKTFQILLSIGAADPFIFGGVLVADMIALKRETLLEQLRQSMVVFEPDCLNAPGVVDPVGKGFWWIDMKFIAQWWLNGSTESLAEAMEAAESDRKEVAAIEEESQSWELASAESSSSDSEASSDEQAFDVSWRTKDSRDMSIEAFENVVEFTTYLTQEVPYGKYGEGIARFVGPGGMDNLADAVVLACKAEMPEGFVRNLLGLLPSRERNDRWREAFLAKIETEVVEEGLQCAALDILEEALRKEDYVQCLAKLRTLRRLGGPSENWGILHLLAPSFMEQASESDICLTVARAYRNRMVGVESVADSDGQPNHMFLPYVLSGGAWLGGASKDEEVNIYWYEMAARDVRIELGKLLGLQGLEELA